MSLKILLADDSVTAQNMGKKILSDAGFEVIAVSNGSAALKKIPDINPDLVILDIYMPGYTGLEVCQKIKEARHTSSLPVLLTVGKLEPFKARDASRVRADGFIVKPFEATELLATIKRIVGVLPEQGRTKAKNGEDSKSRVKQAKLASQEAEAEQLASTLRDVLPPESKDEAQFDHEASQPATEHKSSTENKHEYAPAAAEQVHHESVPFAVSAGSESAEEDQNYQQSTVDAERESARYRVNFDKSSRHAQTAEEGARFTASSFESWEKSRYTPQDPESRESALARIRAARETEATEQQSSDSCGGEDSEKISVSPVNAVSGSEIEAAGAAQADPVATNSSQENEAPRQRSEQHFDSSLPVDDPAKHEFETPAVAGEQPSHTHPPISGLADWAADLREETPRTQESAAVSFASKWIAEESALDANESGLSLSQEMQRSRSSELESLQAEAEAAVEEREGPSVSMTEAVRLPESAESDSIDSSAQPAAHEAAQQPENAETVATLAKAAAAAAMNSISEIREAVLASAAAAGAAGIGRDSIVIQPQASQQPTGEVPSISSPVATKFAATPLAEPANDIQGATIAAVTREVHEAGPADLDSDAIAAIVNRVIEQMKPKLVAEIAKELTHKPKNE